MNSPPSTSKKSHVAERVPDKYGMIVNDFLYKQRRYKRNKKNVYVSEALSKAIKLVMIGGSVLKACKEFNIDRRVLLKKLKLLREFRENQGSGGMGHSSMGKQGGVPRPKKSKKPNEEKLFRPLPVLTKDKSLFNTINRLVGMHSLELPQGFLDAVSDLEDGMGYEDATTKHSLNLAVFVKIVRKLRCAEKGPRTMVPEICLNIRLLLPCLPASQSEAASSPPGSPSNKSLVPSSALSSPTPMSPHRRRCRISWNVSDFVSAIRAINKGMLLKQASRKFSIPYTTLYSRTKQIGIIGKKGIIYPVTEDHLEKLIKENLESWGLLQDQQSLLAASASAVATGRSIKKVNKLKNKAKTSDLLCLFCHRPGDREVELGKLHKVDNVVVHYYCLLFSSALEQNGEDNEGILGFLPKDILKEINRGNKLKCHYCLRRGATIGCNSKSCKRTYHFPCGLDHYAQFTFTDNFSSMCLKHRSFQSASNGGETVECLICFDTLVADSRWAVWPPCCKKSYWFHKMCLQKLALNAGYFFKCPLCNDKDIFVQEMLHQGIFVPEQDASWEREPNAFQELLERPIRCDAGKCKCPSGRKADEEGGRWEVLLCHLCGSTGIHIACGNLKLSCTEWHCPDCTEMLRESSLRAKQENRGRRVEGRSQKRESTSDGEDEDVDVEEESDSEEGRRRKKRRMMITSSPAAGVLHGGMASSSCVTVKTEGGRGGVVGPSTSSSSLTREDEEVVIREGIRGDVVIRDLVASEGHQPLSPALDEMKTYAEAFPGKLDKARFQVHSFLDMLNSYAQEGRSRKEGTAGAVGEEGATASSSVTSKCVYAVAESHIRRFVECSFTYDQMRLMRKVFEQAFIIHILKAKMSHNVRKARLNPFSGRKHTSGVKISLARKCRTLQKSLVNLLGKARKVNLLEGNRTWSSYDTEGGRSVKSEFGGSVKQERASTSRSLPCSSSSPLKKGEGGGGNSHEPEVFPSQSARYGLNSNSVSLPGSPDVSGQLSTPPSEPLVKGEGRGQRGTRAGGDTTGISPLPKCVVDGSKRKEVDVEVKKRKRRKSGCTPAARKSLRLSKERGTTPLSVRFKMMLEDIDMAEQKFLEDLRSSKTFLGKGAKEKENCCAGREEERQGQSRAFRHVSASPSSGVSVLSPSSPGREKVSPLQTNFIQNSSTSSSPPTPTMRVIEEVLTASEIKEFNLLHTPTSSSHLIRNLFGAQNSPLGNSPSGKSPSGDSPLGNSPLGGSDSPKIVSVFPPRPSSALNLFGTTRAKAEGTCATPKAPKRRYHRTKDTNKYFQPSIDSFFKVQPKPK